MLWSSEKAQKLNQFVIDWGKTMEQTYREYTPEHNVDLYGLQLPKDVLAVDGWHAVIEDIPINIEWSDDGIGEEYALIAVFSDADTQPYLQKHVYFFVIVSGEPKVLITQQNQGNENNYLYFRETENKELKEGFKNIIDNKEIEKNQEYISSDNPAYEQFTNEVIPEEYFGDWRVFHKPITFILSENENILNFGNESIKISNPRVENNVLVFDSKFTESGSAPIITIYIELIDSENGLISFETDRGEISAHKFFVNDR